LSARLKLTKNKTNKCLLRKNRRAAKKPRSKGNRPERKRLSALVGKGLAAVRPKENRPKNANAGKTSPRYQRGTCFWGVILLELRTKYSLFHLRIGVGLMICLYFNPGRSDAAPWTVLGCGAPHIGPSHVLKGFIFLNH